jgi:hypothetical protein
LAPADDPQAKGDTPLVKASAKGREVERPLGWIHPAYIAEPERASSIDPGAQRRAHPVGDPDHALGRDAHRL